MDGMDNLHVRSLALADIAELIEIDHSYHAEYVWQMDLQSLEGEVNIQFREVRLPRSMLVEYPYDAKVLVEDWQMRDGVLVAELEESAVGYISMNHNPATALASVADLAVLRRLRRHGIGTALLLAAQTWAGQKGATRLMVEMQSKNHPMVSLANKLGYEFCGYNDRYYLNQDIALFFAKRL
jgi:GNAT superfamily N-acetyltransferase